ncbi:MAG: NnrU family protein, partial [Gammaproteobacteria bacterium]
LANGRLADVLLFGSFFAWALFAHHAARARDRAAGTIPPEAGPRSRDLMAISAGVVLWAAVILWLHQWIGVLPLLPPGMQLSF